MSDALGKLATLSPWVILAIALVGIALVVAAVLLLRRSRAAPAKEPEKPKERPLSAVWADFVGRLPASARGDPVVVVLGERLAGKSRIVEGALELGAQAALVSPSAPDDPRLTLHAGRQVLVQEISGELLEDVRPETRDALRRLWRPMALQAPLVLVVLRPRSASWTPAGLRTLGSQARDAIDVLTALRGSPPRVRVCLTHLDEEGEGFVELAPAVGDAGHPGGIAISGRRASDLAASLSPLEARLTPALGKSSAAELTKATHFLKEGGPALLAALEPFLEALLGGRSSAQPPALDGIVLGALPEKGKRYLLGDPFALDAKAIAQDVRALERRRTLRSMAIGAAAAALLLLFYIVHYGTVQQAVDDVARFESAVARAQAQPTRTWSLNRDAREAEARAADAADAALTPVWLPLRYAYVDDKEQGIEQPLLAQIRKLYLLPATLGENRVKRIHAGALLYASEGSRLGQHVLREKRAWVSALGLPERVVDDYIERSEEPWDGALSPLPADAGAVTAGEWTAFLDALSAALNRETITRVELEKLQQAAARLSGALQGAVEIQSLANLRALIQDELGAAHAEEIFGPDVAAEVPEWATASRDALEPLFELVRQGSLDVPGAQDKGLQQALSDIKTIARKEGDAPSPVYEVKVDAEPRTYRADAWADLLRASRASLYVQAFMTDVRQTGRTPLFPRDADYPAAGVSASPSRGATTVVPGVYTAKAFNADVKPALLELDDVLKSARVRSDDQAALTRLVREALEGYGKGYHEALWAYLTSFHLQSGTLATLRADLQDMVGSPSWFTQFWEPLAENAAISAENNTYVEIVSRALSPLRPIVDFMAGDKGKYPNLDKYYAIITPLLPSLEGSSLALPAARGTPLADRLPPVGKLGLTLLTPDPAHPLPQVKAFLDGAKLFEPAFRRPFLLPVELAYEHALSSVEAAVAAAYRDEVRPLITPITSRFPFDPSASTQASPAEAEAVLGPKGTFRAAFDTSVAPAAQQGQGGAWAPRRPLDYRAVNVPSEALNLATWATRVASLLWDEGGKPKPIALTAQPRSLPVVKPGAESAVTLSFLRSGKTTVYGFNQTPAVEPLPVSWWTPDPAAVGLVIRTPGGVEEAAKTRSADGDAWRFHRLLCDATPWDHGAVTWVLGRPISFEVQPNPWSQLVAPMNYDRRCAGRDRR